MTDQVKEKPQIKISDDEFRRISNDLDEYHALFHMLWKMGRPTFSTAVPTACVSWDREFRRPRWMFNPDFWLSLDHYNRVWVIAHEMLHLVLNHGARFKDAEAQNVVNVATDIVINHMTVNKFGFHRSKIKNADNYCWVDTTFKKQDPANPISDDKHVEFYLKKLEKMIPPDMEISIGPGSGQPGDGEGSGGMPSTVDDHDSMPSAKDAKEFFKEVDDGLTPEEKADIRDVIEKHYQPDEKDGKSGDGKSDEVNQTRGDSGTGAWTFIDIDRKKIKKKRKWETVILEWCRKKLRPEIKGVERWGRKHRRMSAIDSGRLRLPSEMDVDSFIVEKYKLRLLFFLDVSGSCSSMSERFFKAALSLPEDRFETEFFCFNTQVFPVDKEERKLKVGGGTSFDIIEDAVQKWSAENKSKYADAVFIITDGYGNNVSPEKPERWFFFLSNFHSLHCIPAESHTFMLSDYE